MVVHLLDYLAKDYGLSVENGKIKDAFEYEEQIEFIREAIKQHDSLLKTSSHQQDHKNLHLKLTNLEKLIFEKSEAQIVSALCREIQTEMVKLAKLEVSPSHMPNLSQGAQIFQRNCVSCHGIRGDGKGPLAAQLKPQPTNFRDPEIMREMSPFQAFNTIRLGIPETAMTPFSQLSDEDVWNVAFYVVSLRHLGDAFLNLSEAGSVSLYEFGAPSGKHLPPLTLSKSLLQEALRSYETGNAALARQKALAAYLDGIEPIEAKLRANHPTMVADIEMQMIEIRKLIGTREPIEKLKASIEKTNGTIEKIETLLEKPTSPLLSFTMSSGIILREGFEAVLIIIALLSVLRAANASIAARWVHGGWIAALLVGLISWFLSGRLMVMSGAQRETLEAVTSLLAVAVLLYLGFWLHRKTNIYRWKAFIDDRVKSALSRGNLIALGFISFVAVFREAFETVLFLRAVSLEGGTQTAMLSGVITAFIVVFALAILFLKYARRLPIRKLFGITSLMMVILAMILTGKGLHALQETGALSISHSPLPIRFDLIGFYPTLETLLPQILVLMICGMVWFYTRKTEPT